MTAAAGGLAADRAVAPQERHRGVGVAAEADGAASTGTLEMHGVLMGGAGRDTGMPARAEVLIHRRRCYQHVPVMTAQGEFRSMTGSSHQIGSASCRERVCQSVYISVGAVVLNKKKPIKQLT